MLILLLIVFICFFDVNFVGCILNRFVKDIGCMDEVLLYLFLEIV